MRTCLLPSERVKVDTVVRDGNVDDLDLLESRVEHVKLAPRLRQGERARDAGLQLDAADLLIRGLVDDVDRAVVGADVQQVIAASRNRGAKTSGALGLGGDGGQGEREQDRRSQESQPHHFFSSGKIRSILRQSFWAAAHLAVQSGA